MGQGSSADVIRNSSTLAIRMEVLDRDDSVGSIDAF